MRREAFVYEESPVEACTKGGPCVSTELSQLNGELLQTAEIVLINPLIPQSWGTIFELGEHPQAPGRKYPAPLFRRSLLQCYGFKKLRGDIVPITDGGLKKQTREFAEQRVADIKRTIFPLHRL